MTNKLESVSSLEEALRNLSQEHTFDTLSEKIVGVAAQLMNAVRVVLFMNNEDDQLVPIEVSTKEKAQKFAPNETISPLALEAFRDDEPIYIRSEGNSEHGGDAARTVCTAPLLFDGKILGALEFDFAGDFQLSPSDREVVLVFCHYAAHRFAAQRSRTDLKAKMIELKARSERHDLIHRIGQTIVEGPTLKAAMQRVVDMVASQLHYSWTAVLLFDNQLEELEVICANGYGETDGLRIPVAQGATGYAVRYGEIVNIPDVTTDPRYVSGIRGGRSELVVPVVCEEEVCGAIDVESPILNAFDSEDVHLINIVATYASAAIRAARREEVLHKEQEQRKQREVEVKLLGTVSTALTKAENADELFEMSLKLITDVLNWGNVGLWMVEPESGQIVLKKMRGDLGTDLGMRIRTGEGNIGRAVGQRKPILVRRKGVRSDQNRNQIPEMVVPLFDSGELTCALQVVGGEDDFRSSDLDLLALFGTQISAALTAEGLRRDTREQITRLDDRTRRLDILTRVSRSLTQRMDLDVLLEELLRICREAFELRHCAVLLLDNEKKRLVRKASIGYDEDAPRFLALGEGITGHVAETRVPVLVADVTTDPRYVKGVQGSRAEMASPLLVFGETIGVLDAESIEEGAFDEEDLDLFTCFAAQAAIAIHNADIAEKLKNCQRSGGDS